MAPRTVVNFSALCNVQGLVRDLIKCGGMKGILVEQPFDVFEENGQFRCAPPLVRVEKMFDHVQSKLPGAPKFLLCLLPERKISDLYGPRKKTCLTDFGIVTQCIAPTRVDDHLANVLLKINAKVLLLINFASKALSQSDGRWRYSSDNPESSTYAAGLALEALAGVISLASSEIDQSRVNTVKSDILKLFDSIQKYSTDDGTFYFDEKFASGREHQGSLSTTSSVVRGVTSFAAVTSGKIDLPGDKVLGLAKKNLGIGVPGSAKDFNQVESFTLLESKRVPIPLVLSLPATVYSLSKKDQLKELQYDQSSGLHVLSVFPDNVDVGTYVFVFEMALRDSGSENDYAIGGQIHVPIYVTGIVKVSNAEIAVLDSDLGSDETQKMLDLTGTDVVSLSANHLQKLRFSFQLTTPHGLAFKPRQVLLKLRHKTKYEHIFVVRNTGKKFEIILDFLGLVDKFYYLSGRYNFELTVGDAVMENSFLRPLGHLELDLPEAPEKAARLPPLPVDPYSRYDFELVDKFYYLSGRYDFELTVGDAVMENSFLRPLGHLELDLPEAPEKAARLPLLPVDPYSRYKPKAEIAHLFRAPEKRPPQNVSLAFLILTLLPFIGFLVGLLRLGVNFKNFPSSAVPATYAILFQLGVAAVLLLYVLFWLKLDLFTTLKALGFLGAFLLFVGHRILSHLASTSAKLKSA